MHAGLLDVLHDAADDGISAVGDGIHIHFDGIFQKFVDQHRMLGGGLMARRVKFSSSLRL